ncbi:MAG: ribosome silencing factor [Nitrospira sp.]|nr:ribosome silencing factor [Candidatus Manganitrophaceae bacterium]HIL35203.1 ribosome silencing factor [Candidatus Manganitrophaceae bacterium]
MSRTTISKDILKHSHEKEPRDAKSKALLIAEVARSKHAEQIVTFHVSDLTSLADYFILCSAESDPQLRAVVDAVQDALSKEGLRPLGVEGRDSGRWVLIDYDDVILHVFNEEARAFYNLDGLWGDAPQLPLPESSDENNPVREEKGGETV